MKLLPGRLPGHWRITDHRLRGIVAAVWQRLAEHDRAALAALVEVTDTGELPPDVWGRLAALRIRDGDFRMVLRLNPNTRDVSDNSLTWLVARLFAHAVMRHPLLETSMAALRFQGGNLWRDEDAALLESLQADEASLCAAVAWGFRAEFEQFTAEHPQAFRPAWAKV